MKKTCIKCKGTGYHVLNQKNCEECHGTGIKSELNLKNHVKNISNQAVKHFELNEDQAIPCSNCNGKGEIEVTETCSECNGVGAINTCLKCGKQIKTGDYCINCQEKPEVYQLQSNCGVEDLKLNEDYLGKVSRVENYGVFVSISKDVFGLLRMHSPPYKKGDKIIVKINDIKKRKGEVEITKSKIRDGYELVKLRKNLSQTLIGDLDDNNLGKNVCLIGEITQIQQTSGPTIFTVTDETDTTWVAAFDEPGVRVYPNLSIGNIVEVYGEVNLHSGKIQIESESIEGLNDNEALEAKKRIDESLDKKAEPENTDLLIESEVLNDLRGRMINAAKAIRRAVLDGRSILVRHHADADGICAGVAIEKAVIPLLREENNSNDAEWHFFKRAPSKAPFYELEDVVKDLSFALEDMERHGQKLPLLVLTDNGSTEEDILALMKAKIYDIEIVVVDHHYPGEVKDGKVEVDDYVDVHVNPYLVGGDSQITAGALAVEIAKMINPDVQDKLLHLPGIAAVGDHARSPEAEKYIEIASNQGYTPDDLERIATCVDFEAFYLRFMNGRGIIDTILGLGAKDKHQKLIKALYQETERRVDWQLKAALPNLKTRKLDNNIIFNILDVEKYAHKFTFPAPGKTCGYVHDHVVQEYGEEQPIVTLAYGPDFGVIRATDAVNEIYQFNLNNIILKLMSEIPAAGVDGGGHECAGSLKFVEGLSREVLSAFADEVSNLKVSGD